MDLAKFLSVLDKQALYFARVDKLADADPFEGYYTNADLQIDKLTFEDWSQQTGVADERVYQSRIEFNRTIRGIAKQSRELTFVNSWHLQEHESAAMWAHYLRSRDGVAVTSTYARLLDALAGYTDFGVFVGCIRYIDYNLDLIPKDNILFPFMHKRKSFEHDRELRALIWTPESAKNDCVDPAKNLYRDVPGLYVGVDLGRLIERVFVAPSAPAWFAELLSAIIARFGLNTTVVQSDLASTPLY